MQGHLQNVTVPLSFFDSHMCRMLLNVWLDSTDEQESKWRDEWPITQQDTKDGNNSHHNKRIPSLNALPLLRCSREPLHFVTIQQYPLCINIISIMSFCFDHVTDLKYMNVMGVFSFPLIKTMFGTCLSCDLFILGKIMNQCFGYIFIGHRQNWPQNVFRRAHKRNSDATLIHLYVQIIIKCSVA